MTKIDGGNYSGKLDAGTTNLNHIMVPRIRGCWNNWGNSRLYFDAGRHQVRWFSFSITNDDRICPMVIYLSQLSGQELVIVASDGSVIGYTTRRGDRKFC